jgi:uncharacterized protein (UPF0332 family)
LNGETLEIVKHWIEKAHRTLETAKYDLKGDFVESSLDRLYYAAFYIVLAYLTLKKERFKKHSGVKSFFFRKIIKAGLLDKNYGKLYNRLYYLREEADYTPNPSFEKEEIEILIKETEDFIEKMEFIIKQEIRYNTKG